ncbi:hypothetical protein GUJ93_ZPchr0009g1896 [Zizania palustris]|uniref:Uncharacterized protein n=1 Tax=Zizania palustris TaxID=103762 RepID=A0A8J5RMS4_ZIZPA|nr:hypothetical protein GUJ93_ZPchr0009g1896 [Zizania palustris]KAG8048720.1 hypothetical protein GUJ93_ZPchr0009g1896 [Zizania palustris]
MERQLQFTWIMSNRPEENPAVKVRYCDGSFFTGEAFDAIWTETCPAWQIHRRVPAVHRLRLAPASSTPYSELSARCPRGTKGDAQEMVKQRRCATLAVVVVPPPELELEWAPRRALGVRTMPTTKKHTTDRNRVTHTVPSLTANPINNALNTAKAIVAGLPKNAQ